MRKFLTLTAAAALALSVGFAAPANAVDLSDGLVGYWPFDDGADPTDDASVNANTGTLGNAAGFDGDDPAFDSDAADIAPVFGNVSSLDFAAGDFVRVTDTTDLEPTDVTVSVWVRNDGAPTSFDYILVKTLNAGFGSYALYTAGGSGLRFFASSAATFFSSDDAGAGVWDGNYHHIAGVYDSSGPTVRLFVDGAEVGSANVGPAAISYASTAGFGDFNIGTHNDESSTFDWIGNIDEVRVYGRVLSDPEIKILASGKALPDPYADEVASFTLPPSPPNDDCLVAGGGCDTTGDDDDQGADAVDAPDNTVHGGGSTGVSTFTSLGFDSDTDVGGILKLNFTDNTCLDLGGDDIQIFEVSHGETYDVDIGLAGGSLANIGNDVSGDASLESSVAVFNQVRLEAESGGAAGTDGPDIDAAECLNSLDFGPDHIQKENTGVDNIDIGVDVVQVGFQFTITIANNTGSNTGLAGILVFDVVPGEFDLVGDTAPAPDNGCTVTLTHPKGAENKLLTKLEPEFITIDPSGLLNGEMCMITVNVETDTKQFQGPKSKSPLFAPTECNEETFIFLNEGVEVWKDDGDTVGVVDKNDTLLFEDDDLPIELTCVFPS